MTKAEIMYEAKMSKLFAVLLILSEIVNTEIYGIGCIALLCLLILTKYNKNSPSSTGGR